jgi:hypothetical protein
MVDHPKNEVSRRQSARERSFVTLVVEGSPKLPQPSNQPQKLRRPKFLFVLHPLANKIRTSNNPEFATFPSDQIAQRFPV